MIRLILVHGTEQHENFIGEKLTELFNSPSFSKVGFGTPGRGLICALLYIDDFEREKDALIFPGSSLTVQKAADKLAEFIREEIISEPQRASSMIGTYLRRAVDTMPDSVVFISRDALARKHSHVIDPGVDIFNVWIGLHGIEEQPSIQTTEQGIYVPDLTDPKPRRQVIAALAEWIIKYEA